MVEVSRENVELTLSYGIDILLVFIVSFYCFPAAVKEVHHV